MTVNCISSNFQRISRDHRFGTQQVTTAKRMKTEPYRKRQRCNPLNVLFIIVFLASISSLGAFIHVLLSRAFLRLSCLIRHGISELPRPIAVKLCHVIYIWLNFIMQVQKFRGSHPPPQKNGTKTCKIWCDFTQLQTLNTNISGTSQAIQNRKGK